MLQLPHMKIKKAYVVLIIILAVILVFINVFPFGNKYVNTKFGYQMDLPRGWEVYQYSNKFDVTARLKENPAYVKFLTYPSTEEAKQAEPELATAYDAEYNAAIESWTPETAQTIILTNGDQTDGVTSGPDKISVVLINTNETYLDEIVEENSEKQIMEKITLENGYNGFVRQVLTPAESGTILVVKLDDLEILSNGKMANAIVFLLAQKVDKDLLMEIAGSVVVK